MKNILIFMIFSLNLSYSQEGIDTLKVDLVGDGRQEIVILTNINNSYHLIVDSSNLDLKSDKIIPIFDQNGDNNRIIISDVDSDSAKEILIATDYNEFTNKSIFRILKFYNGKIHEMPIYYSIDEPTNQIISIGKFNLYDEFKKEVFVVTGRTPYNTDDGDTIFLYKVWLYQWDKKVKRLIYKGEKLYDSIDEQHLNGIIF